MRKTITKLISCYHVDGAENTLIYSDNNLLPETVTVTGLPSVFKNVDLMIFWDCGSKFGRSLEEGDSVSANIPALGGKYTIYAYGTCNSGKEVSSNVTFEVTDED